VNGAMSEAKTAALRYVLHHYGNLVSVEDPIFDKESKTWVTNIRTDYPRIIRNDQRPGEIILKFLSMNRLGTLRFTEDFRPVEVTTRKECIRNLGMYLNLWRERAERIILNTSASQIARIAETQWVLNPVLKVISNLQKKEIIYDEEVLRAPRSDKMKRYLELLESVQLVRRIDKGYTYGNLLTALQDELREDIEGLEAAVLSHVLKTSYPLLRDVFGITQVDRFVHVDSSYYTPALEAERILYLKRESIIAHCENVYGDRDSLGVTQILDKLVRVKALEYSHPFYSANESLFSEMLDLKSKLPELTPPKAGKSLNI